LRRTRLKWVLFLTLRTEHWREDLTLSLTSAKYLGHSCHLNMINAFLRTLLL